MNNELFVLFGGFMILLTLKRPKVKSRRKLKGFIRLTVMLVESLVMLTGISAFMYGLINTLK
ncbi:MAG: hypothetical protein Q8P20_08430 [bacterium]|nr:hypothetical protein [bacterium]